MPNKGVRLKNQQLFFVRCFHAWQNYYSRLLIHIYIQRGKSVMGQVHIGGVIAWPAPILFVVALVRRHLPVFLN